MLLRISPSIHIAWATFVAAALVVTIFVPTYGAVAAEPALRTGLPPIESPIVEPGRSELPAGDFSLRDSEVAVPEAESAVPATPHRRAVKKSLGASGKPGSETSFEVATSVLVDRTEFTNTYRNANGTNTMMVSEQPINVELSGGRWSKISTDVAKDFIGSVRTGAHPLQPMFGSAADVEGVFSVLAGEQRVTFTLEGASASEVVAPLSMRSSLDPNKVLYPDVFDGIDLTYEVETGSVKELLVLKDVGAADESRWVWKVSAPGLMLSSNEFGDIEFRDAADVVQLVIPAPAMWDSSGIKDVQEPSMGPVSMDIQQDGDVWRFVLDADDAWLASEERVYPVYVGDCCRFG